MAIQCQCQSCQHAFSVRNEFGGKRIKCPKCSGVVSIPAVAKTNAGAAVSTQSAPKFNSGLMGLLDEAGVEAKKTGPTCANCASPMAAGSVICVECGFNMATGEKLVTTDFAGALASEETTPKENADQLLEKAEKEIEDTPVDADSQDFGDGADSYAIAIGALLVTTILLTVGLFVVFLMDSITQGTSSSEISLKACIWVGAAGLAWILIGMFIESPAKAVLEIIFIVVGVGIYFGVVVQASRDGTSFDDVNPFKLYTGFIIAVGYAVFYGVTRKGMLIYPAVMLVVAFLVGMASIAGIMFGSGEEAHQLNETIHAMVHLARPKI